MGTEKIILLADLVDSCDIKDLVTFRERYGKALLIYSGKQDELRPSARTWQPTLDAQGRLVGDVAPEQLTRVLLFPMRSNDPDRWMVTVGRGEPNEIIIPDESISMYHATFRRGKRGEYLLRDAGSTNGTFVNDRRVLPKPYGRSARIRSSNSIRFGAVQLTFLLAEEVFDLVRTMSAVQRVTDSSRPSALQSSELFGDLPPSATGKAPLSDSLVAVLEAVQLLEAERYTAAVEVLEQIIAAEPANIDAQIWLHVAQARQLGRRGDAAGALAKYQVVLQLEPEHPEAREAVRVLKGRQR